MNPTRSCERIQVHPSNAIIFNLDAIPHLLKDLPEHYDMAQLMTREQQREARLAPQEGTINQRLGCRNHEHTHYRSMERRFNKRTNNPSLR